VKVCGARIVASTSAIGRSMSVHGPIALRKSHNTVLIKSSIGVPVKIAVENFQRSSVDGYRTQ
jgi:hypothetical protein